MKARENGSVEDKDCRTRKVSPANWSRKLVPSLSCTLKLTVIYNDKFK